MVFGQFTSRDNRIKLKALQSRRNRNKDWQALKTSAERNDHEERDKSFQLHYRWMLPTGILDFRASTQRKKKIRSKRRGLAYRRFSFLYFKIRTMKSGRQGTINGVGECKMCFCNTKTLVPDPQGLLPPGKSLINPSD